MEKSKHPFNKEEMANELRGVLVHFAHEIGRMYRYAYSYRLLGLECRVDNPENYDDPFVDHEADLASLDIDRFWITSTMVRLYDYAFEAIHHPSLDWSVVDEDVDGFFRGLEDFPLVDNNVGTLGELPEYSIRKCRHVIDLAIARAYLNGDSEILEYSYDTERPAGSLTLRQIALLAEIDEKTVRNLAGPKSKQPLKTINVGNRTFVEMEVARAWLSARGQLKQTVMADRHLRDLATKGFLSILDLTQFVRRQRERLQLSVENVAEQVGVEPAAIEAIERGEFEFEPGLCVRLAQVIQVDQKSFAKAALKVFQAAQLVEMENEIERRLQPEGYGTW